MTNYSNNSNIIDIFCANILEDQAQLRDKTKGLNNLVIVKMGQVVNGCMKVIGRQGIWAALKRRQRNETITSSF